MKNNTQLKSTVSLLVASGIWGLATSAQKIASDSVPAFLVGSIRSLLAFVFLFLVIPVLDRVLHTGRNLFEGNKLDFTRQEIVGGIVCGAFLTAGTACQQYAFSGGAEVGSTAFITSLYIVFIPVIEFFVLRKRPRSGTLVAVPAAAVGFYFLALFGKAATFGFADLMALGAALCFSGHILYTGRYAAKGDPVRISCLQFFFAFLFNAVASLVAGEGFEWTSISAAMNSLIYLGILSSGIGFTLQTVGQKGADPTAACFILATESVFAAIGGAVMFGEKKTLPEIAGCVIIFASVIFAQIDLSQIRGFFRSLFGKKSASDERNSD